MLAPQRTILALLPCLSLFFSACSQPSPQVSGPTGGSHAQPGKLPAPVQLLSDDSEVVEEKISLPAPPPAYLATSIRVASSDYNRRKASPGRS